MMNYARKAMPRISLSIYSFGYSAGFIHDSRLDTIDHRILNPDKVAVLARELGLGGVEIPIDRYFPNTENADLQNYIENLQDLGLKIYFDLEEFNPNYIQQMVPLLCKHGTFIRAKVSNFYGGNRYRHLVQYSQDLNQFSKQLEKCLKILKNNKMKVLIENHQDIVLRDVDDLIMRFGKEIIGINWDIGNSLPSGETVESFLEKEADIIRNVHLKDYALYECDEGYILRRCALGDGFVDFEYCFKKLDKSVPMTIELGAQNSRKAEINHPDYWKHTRGIEAIEKETFLNFIKENVKSGDYRTVWELKRPPDEIIESEHEDLIRSVKYLRTLNQNLYDSAYD